MNKAKDYAVIVGCASLAAIAVVAVLGYLAEPAAPIIVEPGMAVRERIAIDARDDSYFHSGADVYVYSDDHSTQELHIDGATGDITLDGTLNIDDEDSTITSTQSISVTSSFYEFTPTSVLTLTLDTDGVSVGDWLLIQNTGTSNVVLVDTGATIGGGNITLGQNDTALFVYVNSKWVMVSTANNS